MAVIVQKYGGTSVADIDRIRHVAARVKREADAGHQLVVVLSAMSGKTNELVGFADAFDGLTLDRDSYDMVVSSGEQVTIGLLAMALNQMNVPATAMLGWQVPIETDAAHSRARIKSIDPANMRAELAAGRVIVVAGFQGISPDQRITTLGRGGSDTTAVALAAALEADRCDIFTDVTGVFTTDPRIVENARQLDAIAYEEMLEMASLGAKVLQTRSVALAMQQGVRVQVLSSFDDVPGTMVIDEEEIVESQIVSGIAYSRDEAKMTLVDVADRPGVAASIFGPLSAAGINVDMIVQSVSTDGSGTDLTFTVGRADLDHARKILDPRINEIGAQRVEADANVCKVSVIGVGMRSHAGVAHTMFQTLAEKGINVQAISTSEIKVSVLIAAEYTELALRALHTAYGLDAV